MLQAAQALVTKGIDLFFVSTDSTVVASLEAVVKVANENKKPLFGNDPSSAARGAAAALGIDYEQVGYESGQMAAIVLTGQKPMSETCRSRRRASARSRSTRRRPLGSGVTFPADVMKRRPSRRTTRLRLPSRNPRKVVAQAGPFRPGPHSLRMQANRRWPPHGLWSALTAPI